MNELPLSLAFFMVKESFAVPAILFYLASNANKNHHTDHLNSLSAKSVLGGEKLVATYSIST